MQAFVRSALCQIIHVPPLKHGDPNVNEAVDALIVEELVVNPDEVGIKLFEFEIDASEEEEIFVCA